MSSLNCQNYIITQKPVANSLNSVTSSPQTNPHHSFLQSVHTVAAALHPTGRPQSVTDHLNTGQRERSEHPTNPHPASAELHRRGREDAENTAWLRISVFPCRATTSQTYMKYLLWWWALFFSWTLTETFGQQRNFLWFRFINLSSQTRTFFLTVSIYCFISSCRFLFYFLFMELYYSAYFIFSVKLGSFIVCHVLPH